MMSSETKSSNIPRDGISRIAKENVHVAEFKEVARIANSQLDSLTAADIEDLRWFWDVYRHTLPLKE